ncbi:MAG: putative amino acid permease YhdG [Bacteroidia bacterium]|nr:putative amino acid permease YhdG [Bacteroidia bacterium]
MHEQVKLERSLGPLMLWGLGVGYVISGMYFGWNLGLEKGGTLGLGIATFFIMLMYITFSLCYTELACAIPKAGGAFDYADKALGKQLGFVAGMAQIIEFVFAPPAIAFGIGAYFHLLFPELPVTGVAVFCYFAFTLLNILGVKASASFELFITIVAVVELLIFSGFTLPHFKFENLTLNNFPNGVEGIFMAIPFAIWFFLGLEGIANVAEETINPQKNITIGFASAMFTLAVLATLTFSSAVGVAGWEAVVFNEDGTASDSPLPMAVRHIPAISDVFYHLLIWIGLFGFVASFNGLLLAAGRATYEFGKSGNAPSFLGKINPRFKTPAAALVFNMVVGIIALFTGKTGDIITIATFGALSLYILSMLSYFELKRKMPELERPFKAPYYPLFPTIALVIAVIAIISMSVYNPMLAAIFFGLMAVAFAAYYLFVKAQ